MMSPGKDYSPCPHCTANNITHRNICWRCGHTLPYTVGIDGRAYANSEPNAQPMSSADIEHLLNQAVTIDVAGAKRKQSETEKSESEANKKRLNAFAWLKRRIERQSGA